MRIFGSKWDEVKETETMRTVAVHNLYFSLNIRKIKTRKDYFNIRHNVLLLAIMNDRPYVAIFRQNKLQKKFKKNWPIIILFILPNCDQILSKRLPKIIWQINIYNNILQKLKSVIHQKDDKMSRRCNNHKVAEKCPQMSTNVHKCLVTEHEVKWPTRRNKVGGRTKQNLILKK